MFYQYKTGARLFAMGFGYGGMRSWIRLPNGPERSRMLPKDRCSSKNESQNTSPDPGDVLTPEM